MYFKNLEINNFRGIQHFKAEDFGDINLFVGKNNSRKTTVLESLFLVLGASNPELIMRINGFRDLILNEEDDLRFVFYNLDYNNQPKIKANTFEQNGFRELLIKPAAKFNNTKKEKTIDTDNTQLSYDTSHSEEVINELSLKLGIKDFHKQKKDFEAKLTIERGRITITEARNYSEQLRGVYITPKIHLTTNLEKQLENLIINKKHTEVIEVLNKVDNTIKNITFGTNRMIYFDVEGINRLIPINLVGDGVRRILAIILSIYDAQNGIALIDEIENGLHFSVLKSLWTVVFEASQKFKVQLFATTHNIETLKYLKLAIEEKENTEIADKIRSYTLRKLEEDKIKSYKYDYEKFEFSIEQGIEIR